jgi:hypothetical protein
MAMAVQGKITPHVEMVPIFFPLAFVGPARSWQFGGLAGLVFFGIVSAAVHDAFAAGRLDLAHFVERGGPRWPHVG